MTDRIDALRSALATVQDPDLHQDLVALNMVRDLVIDGDTARFKLVLTTGACPVKQQLEDACRAAALTVPGVVRAVIEVSAEVPRGPNGEDVLPGVRAVIGVGSGKGGVGKSTVTANLAIALAAMGARVGLLDADLYGPSIPMMFGINQQPEVVDKKLQPPEAHGIKLMSIGFLLDERQPVIWRGPMLVGALKQFLTDVAWGELDYLLVDLPPGTGDIQLTLVQNTRLTGAVLVSTPQAVALADAKRAAAMFDKVNVPIIGMCENMADFVCPSCGHVEAIFGRGGAEDEASRLGVPFLGRIPLEPAVRAAGDDGTPVVLAHPDSLSAKAFRALAQQVAARVSVLNLKATQ